MQNGTEVCLLCRSGQLCGCMYHTSRSICLRKRVLDYDNYPAHKNHNHQDDNFFFFFNSKVYYSVMHLLLHLVVMTVHLLELSGITFKQLKMKMSETKWV